jgi:hypothetical protein
MASGRLVHHVQTGLVPIFKWGSVQPKHLFSPDRSLAVIAFENMTFEIIDLQNWRFLIEGPMRRLLCIAVSTTGTLLAACSDDRLIRL